jgi:hypothetical protein
MRSLSSRALVEVVFRAERPNALAAVESPDNDSAEDDQDDVPY